MAAPYVIFKSISKSEKENHVKIVFKAGGCFKVNEARVKYWSTYRS